MYGWLTLICLQLMVFIAVLSWGWYCHQRSLAGQKKLLIALQQRFLKLQQQLLQQRQELDDVYLQVKQQKITSYSESTPPVHQVGLPIQDSHDYEKIRHLFNQGIASDIVQDSFNLSRSELEILLALQKSAA